MPLGQGRVRGSRTRRAMVTLAWVRLAIKTLLRTADMRSPLTQGAIPARPGSKCSSVNWSDVVPTYDLSRRRSRSSRRQLINELVASNADEVLRSDVVQRAAPDLVDRRENCLRCQILR